MPQDFFTAKVRIVKAMQKANRPLILQHISKLSKISVQLTAYHMKQMVEWGIAGTVDVNGDDKTYYMLQPAYYDRNWLEALFALMLPYLTGMQKQMDFSEAKVESPQAIVRNLSMFLRLFEEKIEKIPLQEETSKTL
jgi:DNA-binding transcriptional regulator GbsR (MarR family)